MNPEEQANDVIYNLDERASQQELDFGRQFSTSCLGMPDICADCTEMDFDCYRKRML